VNAQAKVSGVLARIFGFGRVPVDAAERREYLQRRIAFYLGVTFAMWLGLSCVVIGVQIAKPDQPGPLWIWPWFWAHLGGTSAALVLWLFLRRGERSITTLAAVDAHAITTQGLLLALILVESEPRYRPDLGVLLGLVHILMLRAAVVPSTAQRTAVLGAVATIPSVVATWWTYSHGTPVPGYPAAIFFVVFAIAFSTLAIACTTIISRVIWSLERRVVEAMQLGQYTLEAKIGEGGMGMVYRARHALLRRPTAVKLLSAERAGAVAVARFEREVQLTSSLTHPNTIAIFDYGRTPDGVFYYAMEYLDGIDLETLVRVDGAQPPARVAHILAQVCGALAEAHDAGLVHRDIKPANLVLCDRGRLPDFVKVLDFGLVKDLDAPADAALSNVAQIAGTPMYMSPEAIKTPEAVDARSDLYALGCVAYYLLTGGPVFEGRSVVELCGHHLYSTPVAPSVRGRGEIPAALDKLVLACLAKDPADRPASAADVLEALTRAATGWSVSDARRWWAERGPAVRASRARAAGEALAAGRTVAVDFARRRAA